MKHIIPTLTLTTLAAASAVAQTAAVKGNGLTYDRIAVGYGQTDITKGLSGSFTALLGDYVVVGGAYGDIDGRDSNGIAYSVLSGNSNAFLVGAKFTAGPGDIVVGYTYTQLQLSGALGTDVYGLTGDTDTFSIGYRYAVSSAVELSLSVSRVTGDAAYAVIDTTAGTLGDVVAADTVDFKDTTYSLGVRFNLTKQFDISAGYTFADENGWTVSAGYNF